MDQAGKRLELVVTLSMAALATAVLWFYWPILTKLVTHLCHSEDFSYGLLLPFVIGYIVYLKLPDIRKSLWRSSPFGLLFIVAGFGFYILGELSADFYITCLSFVIVITGLLLLMGDWTLVRLLLFPLFLLMLLIPLPGLVLKQLTLPLQLISSRLATALLQVVGIPAFRQGNVIDLGLRQMQIVEACSGLRYILALFALGVIFCYFFQRRPWKVILLLIMLIPSAIVANAFRVTGMGIFPALQVEGFWHAFSGWLIFIFCLAILGSFNYLFNKIQAEPLVKLTSSEPPLPKEKRFLVIESYLLIALSLVFIAAPLVTRAAQAPPVKLKESFLSFPMQLGPWRGQDVPIDPEMVKATKSDAHLNAEFSRPGKPPITLWIAYYESQKKSGGFVHSPKLCLTGGGWTELTTGTEQIDKGHPVNSMLVEQMGNRVLFYYWYMQRGRWVTNEYYNKLFMGYDGLFRHRTDGALIRLSTPVTPDIQTAQERLKAFARVLIPILSNFIPN
jgi:exosortase D (VPLPA-CTERM-specific)